MFIKLNLFASCLMEKDEGITSKNWPVYAKGLSITYLILVFLFIVIGNIFVIAVQIRDGSSNFPISTKHFIVNLAIADLSVGIFIVPFSVATLFDVEYCTSVHFQRLIGLVNYCFCISSVVTLAILSLDRYLVMAFSLRFYSIMTPIRAKIICVLIWSYTLVFAVPPVVTPGYEYKCIIPNIGSCSMEDWTESSTTVTLTLSIITFTVGLSLLCMLLSYFKIFFIARRHAKRIQGEYMAIKRSVNEMNELCQTNITPAHIESQSEGRGYHKCDDMCDKSKGRKMIFTPPTSGNLSAPKSLESNCVLKTNRGDIKQFPTSKLAGEIFIVPNHCGDKKRNQILKNQQFKSDIAQARNLLLIIGMFFLCWSPLVITLLIQIYIGSKFNPNVNLVLIWVAYSNSFCNPIIYCFRYRSFRIALDSLLRRIQFQFRVSNEVTRTQVGPFK